MSLRNPALVLALLLFGACSSVRPTGRSVFHFDVEGVSYEVISLSLASGEGVNYLLRREDDRVVFRARDDDQDGHIDVSKEAPRVVNAGVPEHAEKHVGVHQCSSTTADRRNAGTQPPPAMTAGRP